MQAARNLFMLHDAKLVHAKAIVRDRGNQFTAAFDEVFRTEGMKKLQPAPTAPVAAATSAVTAAALLLSKDEQADGGRHPAPPL